MAIIYSYPTVVPKLIDKIILTQSYDVNAAAPIKGNPTRAALISDIVDLTGVTTGTANTLPIFTGAGLANSIITQNTAGNSISIGSEDSQEVIIEAILNIQGPVKDAGGSLGSGQQVLVSNANGGVSWGAHTTGTVKGIGTLNFLPKWSAGDTLQNSIIFEDGTNVGIGTSGINPVDKLHVQGTVRAVVQGSSGTAFNAINAFGVSSALRFDNNHAVLALKNNSNVITTKINSSGFSWFNGGQVGFGTTTPKAAVDIVATVENNGLLLSNVGDNSAYDSVRFTYSGFNAGSPEFIFTPKTQPSAGLTNTFFRFKTNGGASIANVANVSIDGKLGVGTTTPLANLDVKETTTNVAGQIIVGGLIDSSTDDTPFGKLCFANTANSNSQPNKILASIEGRKNGSSNRGILTFGMADGSGSNWEKMRIDSYGKVAIGTVTPVSQLTVNGGDIEVEDENKGLILHSPNNTRYRITVANDGTLSTAAL